MNEKSYGFEINGLKTKKKLKVQKRPNPFVY